MRGVDCQYPAKAAPSLESAHYNFAQSSQPAQVDQPLPDFFAPGNTIVADGDGIAFDSLFLSQNDVHDFFGSSSPWDSIEWPSALPLQPASNVALQLEPFSPERVVSETPTFNSSFTLPKTMSPLPLQIMKSPTFSIALISHREYADAGAQRVSLLMLRTLKSYPLMMMRQKAPPPFIHPSLLISDSDENLEAWHNCMSLVHMVSSDIRGSRKLFWRNVRTECERFCEQVCTDYYCGQRQY